ncbi:hypothetical protein Ahy_B01g053443 isoform B [Arachis hypogaea]|uniref:Uncharacterized protein n=1 Tax=Arachis hypogaea TaxID=3818 RepID=A0A445ARS6_ARAHY|nr:hypothetical protein Ahy_B01g053443 isoform B [Arachis hypogaea]
MEKKLTLLQTVATAGVFSAISFWYGFMFGRESSRKELSQLCCVTYHDNTAQVISESVMEALHVVRVNLEGSPSFQHRHGITP